MEKQPFPHDATPDVHAFSSPPENVKDLINRYGTYNIQPTADTENAFQSLPLTREVAQSAGGRDDKRKRCGKIRVSPPVSHTLDSPLVRGGLKSSPQPPAKSGHFFCHKLSVTLLI